MRMLARMPRCNMSTFDSCTVHLTCMCDRSGSLMIVCRSRMIAPSSTIDAWLLLPPARLLVGIDHHAVVGAHDGAFLQLLLPSLEPIFFQLEGRLFRSHAGLGRVARAFQADQRLGLGEFLQHRDRRLGHVQIELRSLHGKRLGIALQGRDVTLAVPSCW